MYTREKRQLRKKENNPKWKKKRHNNAIIKNMIIPIIVGITLGLIAKWVDVPELTSELPIFDDIFARFGIWIFTATLLSIFSDTPMYAAIRVFIFFVSMVFSYYIYTILFLGFFPKEQIILWSIISLISPFCGAIIWNVRGNGEISCILAALPITILYTEWYLTGNENGLLFIAYAFMTVFFIIFIFQNIKQCLSIMVITVILSFILIKTGTINYLYIRLLNI